MRQVKAIYECNAMAQIPEGNYDGNWHKNSILFSVQMPATEQSKQPFMQNCEIKTDEEKTDTPVMVVAVGPYFYIFKKSELN